MENPHILTLVSEYTSPQCWTNYRWLCTHIFHDVFKALPSGISESVVTLTHMKWLGTHVALSCCFRNRGNLGSAPAWGSGKVRYLGASLVPGETHVRVSILEKKRGRANPPALGSATYWCETTLVNVLVNTSFLKHWLWLSVWFKWLVLLLHLTPWFIHFFPPTLWL